MVKKARTGAEKPTRKGPWPRVGVIVGIVAGLFAIGAACFWMGYYVCEAKSTRALSNAISEKNEFKCKYDEVKSTLGASQKKWEYEKTELTQKLELAEQKRAEAEQKRAEAEAQNANLEAFVRELEDVIRDRDRSTGSHPSR